MFLRCMHHWANKFFFQQALMADISLGNDTYTAKVSKFACKLETIIPPGPNASKLVYRR